MSPTSPPPARKAALAFIFGSAVLDVMAMGIIIPVLPKLIEQFIGATGQAGTINGLFLAVWALMQFVASPIMGCLSDRYGRRPIILISAAGMAANYVLMAVAPNLWWLALGRIIAGITSASFTTISAYMADVTPPEQRARAYGLLGAAFGAGFIAGPLLGGLAGDFSPRAPFWAAAALSGVAFIYGMFVLPESLARENRMDFSWRRANALGALRLLRTHRELSGLACVNFLLHFAHYVFATVYVLYVGHRFGWSTGEIGMLLALVGAIDMTTQGVLVGPLVKRFGDRRVMVVGLFGGALGVAWMGLAPNSLWFILAVIPNAMWGLAMPTIQSLMTQRVSESEQGQLQGANVSVASIAGVAAPVLFGAVYTLSIGKHPVLPHPGAAFLLAAAILLVAAALGWFVARRATRDEAVAAL
jgi:DHA1 family tetracycline resistance protein-like MFS transporter